MKKNIFLLFFILSFLSINAQNTRSSISYTEAPFFHGVASGDPTPNEVIIWTKVTPPNGNITQTEVYWQIATDTAFQNIVNFGKTNTSETRDFTVKIDVCGLQPNTYYYYVFKAFGRNSVIGRTKTAPTGNNAMAKYAVASCSNYEHGFFNAYESMYNRNDFDAVIHLGDYYYEYEAGGYSSSVITDDFGRTVLPTNETINLDDYRARHSHYKLDNQLQLVHQIYPFITTWDDHETADNSYKDGAGNHNPATEGPWQNRKVSSFQAYDEWMPIRMDNAMNQGKIWRKLRYGDLLDLIIVDTRIWGRDEQSMNLSNDTSHHLLGNDQFAWLETALADTSTQWKIICNQMMMAPLEIFGIPVNDDQWDGYNAQRQRLINYLQQNNIKNTVVLTGDIHTAWANNISGSATEYVVTSVTSPGLDAIESALGQLPQAVLDLFGGTGATFLKALNSHMKYINLDKHGYLAFSVTNTKAQADFIYVEKEDTVFVDDIATSWYTANNASSQVEASAPFPFGTGAIKPPKAPIQTIPFAILEDTIFVSVAENNSLNACLVNANAICPSVNASILENASFGTESVSNLCYTYDAITNYYGFDTFQIQLCKTIAPFTCDTIMVIVEIIGNNDIDTLTYSIMNDSLLQDCIVFDDLSAPIDTISFYGGANSGTLSIDANDCIVFEPDTAFCGVDAFTLFACDSNGICDTVILNFIIDGTVSTEIVNLYGEDTELLSHCTNYDDLQGNIISTNFIYNGNNANALVYNDTCLSYKSFPLFDGIDTLRTYACDDYTPQKCDTVLYYIHITHPIDTTPPVDTPGTAIKEVENNQFAVLGIYPNPFDVEIIIQYYQFTKDNISLKLFDASGKVIYDEEIKDNTIGLKYAQLKTDKLARGNYILQISNPNFRYTKKLLK